MPHLQALKDPAVVQDHQEDQPNSKNKHLNWILLNKKYICIYARVLASTIAAILAENACIYYYSTYKQLRYIALQAQIEVLFCHKNKCTHTNITHHC